ncbi:uncharacterized protein MELLADRAFT_64232 [Melampsora larici-populina 98AG31]|uniref:Uncharacterized protein n=1 Tax=Melampsora larici-populina (strain 98AG31 / pathotype 3-4-7) TaxID=747676 RepID=F4RQP0_MELLP|nr:uncharacterized protein MELLADRAFT_64232 [Melampsora larici-populina 98AG31]EGG05288.1 hypothetical protein MELLADRAFT_64232 [Melampsora larici-populina 98AG31]
MADPNESTTHGLYLTGNFEIEKKTSPENGWRSEYRTYTTCISGGGAHRNNRMSYEVVARGFGPAQFKLEEGSIYFLRGSFFPLNKEDTTGDILFFEASDRILIGPADTFAGDLVNSIGVTGVGIVTAIAKMPEPITNGCLPNPSDGEKIVTIVTVLHSDYHPTVRTVLNPLQLITDNILPQLKVPKQCKIQYRIPPTRNLAGVPKILQVGREYQFHGFLKDFDEDQCVYVVLASKVTPTTGSKEYDVGIKPIDTKAKDAKPDITGKKPANRQFLAPILKRVPADYGPCSFSPASTHPTPGASNSSSDTALANEDVNTLGKKKGRSQPKRITKKSRTLDLSNEV